MIRYMTKIQNDAPCEHKRHAGSTPATSTIYKKNIALEHNLSQLLDYEKGYFINYTSYKFKPLLPRRDV